MHKIDQLSTFCQNLLKLDINKNDEKIKFIVIANKFNDVLDEAISSNIYNDFNTAKILLAGCLSFEKVNQELFINSLKVEKNKDYTDVINEHTEYLF